MQELETEFNALGQQYAGKNWKELEVLSQLSADVRNLGSRFAQAEKIQGFVLSLNGVDASRRIVSWPEHIFENDELEVKLAYLPKSNLSVGKEVSFKLALPVPALKPAVKVEPKAAPEAK